MSGRSEMQPSFCAIGIDVGGTKIAAGLVAFPEGQILARRLVPTSAGRGGELVFADVLRLAQELAAEARTRALTVDAVGLGLCEIIDLHGNIVSSNCIAWESVRVVARLATVAPAVIEADVRAAALGEALFGAGRPFRNFLYVTAGTGISCCLVLDGTPFTGARGAAGTMASSPLPRTAHGPNTERTPTLEEIASGPALVARYNQRAGAAAGSGKEVLAAAIAGDTIAIDTVRWAGEALGAATGWLVNVLDPEAVVIGGGLGLSDGLYWDSLISTTREHIWSALNRNLPIVRAANGPDAGVIGAAAVAWKRFTSAAIQGT